MVPAPEAAAEKMFLPIGDTPNSGRWPLVTWFLIAANVAVYLFISLPQSVKRPDPADPLLAEYLEVLGSTASQTQKTATAVVSAYDLFLFRHGYRPAIPSLTALFVAMFLHGGFMHLAGNMLFLWIYGDNVENRLGFWRYLAAYLGTGAAASLFFSLFSGEGRLPMVGASGAISGVLGFYYLWFPENRVKVFVFLFPFLMDVVLVPARFVLGFYLLVENLLPFVFAPGSTGGVAYGAHIGGFVAGIALAWLGGRLRERA